MAPSQDVEVENAVKLGGFAFHRRQDKPIQTKFGMQVYIVGLLQSYKVGHDRLSGWVQEFPEFLIAWSAGQHYVFNCCRVAAY